ncbi:hypothetical protein SUS17_3842 [Sphingomonas sp. S17]|uniref:Uncharacterized protein n=3 Tax=Sphingomonadaceae TaxID=41297 RepID=A0A411LM40_SPHPI|nr:MULTISPECIES: hypothetical protein [Sphingomonas]EGI53322.1 hypothetical protein SUS17_3842 [Sphingomonas sp. S17]MBQ1479269.1 hypothetical protein [Sphingomonas sp.]MCM3679965.1 hypothetical protein [Sphingomonas paucimobilis]MDG5970639.1 hypothetical protein [Sphingomonas paucimobilis]NNG59073.1 hypothetical protein [Sphingomonas paucimobilis]
MNPMLDPDLIEYMDDATLLEAFALVQETSDQDDRDVILAEMARRNLGGTTPMAPVRMECRP